MADSIISLSAHGGVVWPLSPVWLFVTPWTVARQAPLSMDFPGKNTEMCCHFLLQGIFPTEGSNRSLLHCREILYHWATNGARERWQKSLRHKHLNCFKWGPSTPWPPPERSYVKAGVYIYSFLWWGWYRLWNDSSALCVREILLSLIKLIACLSLPLSFNSKF